MSHALKQRAPPARPPAHPEEARLRALLEQSGEGRWLSDAAGRDLYVSPSLWALLGQSPTDPRTSLLEALPMPARLQLQASHQAALAAPGKPVGVELELQGLHRWVEACLTNHLDHLDLRAVIGTFRDVSAQKAAQADQEQLAQLQRATRALELRCQRLIESTAQGVWMADASSRITFMNAQMAAMLGCELQQVVGKDSALFVPEAGRLASRERAVARQGGTSSSTFEMQLQRLDGTLFWASVQVSPIWSDDGDHEGSFAIVTDVSARRLAEEGRRQLAAIVESSDDAIVSETLDGRITTWNRAAERLFGFTAADVLGQSMLQLVPDDLRARADEVSRRVAAGESVAPYPTTKLHRDGHSIHVSLTVSALHDEHGRIVGLSRIMRDLTAQLLTEAKLKRMEAQSHQANKMEAIGSLAGGIAHDFNNLLTVILSYATLNIESMLPGDPVRDEMLEIQKAGLRAAGLTQQLLAFSRQQPLQPRVLDLNESVAGIQKMLRRLLGEDVELATLTSQPVGKVHADPGQIEQILMNLAVNARDAMPEGGNLTIETGNVELDADYAAAHLGVASGPYVMLAVTDTGCGMDEATVARIFEPFYTTKEKGKGTGLGLSTVFGIVKQSGGHIWVYSEPGKGTTFKVYLPRTDRQVDAEAPTSAAGRPRGCETVLLVEDDDAVRSILRSVLRKQGYTVLEAQNGGEAFLVCEKFPASIQLLVTDMVMPRMNGRELASRLWQLRPELRVLFISGYTESTVLHHGSLDAGVTFLSKPVMPDGLLRKVREALDAPARAPLL